MSDDQIAAALGEIKGKLDSLHVEFTRYTDDHGARHDKIDRKLDEHAAHINQQRGAKAVLLVLAGAISAAITFIGKKVF